MKLRSLFAAGTVTLAAVALPSAASALDTTQQIVAGTTSSTLSLSVPVAAAFGTDFGPTGLEAQSTGGSVLALSTSPNWTLSVKDYGTTGADGDGTMDKLNATSAAALVAGGLLADAAAATAAVDTCAASESELLNPVEVTAVPHVPNTNVVSAAKAALDGTGITVANSKATTLVPLAATTFDTTFFQTIGTSEPVTSNCIYTIKAAYTVS